MNRHLFGLVLGISMVVVATQTRVFSDDKVERRQSDKINSVSGKIVDESVAGVKIKAGMKESMIPASEIHRVFYDDMPIASKQGYINLWNLEDTEKDLAKVFKAYQDFHPKAATAPAPVKRNIEYRLAALQAATAETDEQKKEARRVLQQFISTHGTSWQFSLASRALARLQVDLAEWDGAQKTLEGIIRSNQVPVEFRQDADLMLVDVLFQSNKIEEVKSKVSAALNDPKTSEPQKVRFGIYQAAIEAKAPDAKIEAVIKSLEAIVGKTTDNTVKALAYNVMGDCYSDKGMKRHAMWSYLWVDVVYNQDRGEHLKAMNGLLKIFKEEKDTEKIQIYTEKIARIR